MTLLEIEKELIEGIKMANPISKGSCISKEKQGYYAIWIKDINKLPSPFSDELIKRNTQLLYIGIAEITLYQRLYLQELQHQNPATFFRSIGAVLKYKPEPGSLVGMKNDKNYRFSKEKTKEIIKWIDESIEISFYCIDRASKTDEITLIKKYTPLLNWTYNPNKFSALKIEKDECRSIARKL